ncbi:MalY/PatB family protein [Streptomyces botrytidirepellens]|uniref:cysteine-S-conjugate beta-lyase n=1 Tax=Streptomyces botrytidirepellens TaxID=2486417 RepID=A0A3M8T818_9ACTN|nr:aminotransferase class I/II-fold pyridoxal phosphate-dependent enzyme [Streptomyces botrytidirepellens]RNF89719.1 aminotransferase class I/II-fold pyridoxal phosphate-dependent enzyme [Streptomyces botrytidirepellens]
MDLTPPRPADDDPNPLNRLTLDQLRLRTSMKWRTYPDDVLPLWVAEMDVPLAEPVVRAVTDAIALGDTGYPAGTAYAEALAGFARERWGWDGLAVERAAIVPDVMLGVVEMLKLVSGPGDAVVVNCPVYPPFYPFVEHMDRRVVEAPLGADLRLDPDALEDAFRRAVAGGRRAAYLLCSPHNPTGTVHTADELAAVAALADRHGVRVVADEIHAPLVAPGTVFTPYLSVPGADSGLSLMSASKGWNLAGLKAALAIAGPAAAEDLARLPEEVGHGPSHIGVIAHTAALRDGGDWLDALLGGLDDNRGLLAGLLARELPGIRYRPGPATFLAWLDCRALGLGDDPAAVFLDRGRVALNSGLPFGTGGAGHVRLNLGTSPEVLAEAVRRMSAALA